MKRTLQNQKNLYLKKTRVVELLCKGDLIKGVRTHLREEICAGAVVLAPGTFLNGLIHIGLNNFPGGRMGEASAGELSDSLRKLGFRMLRFKTGTCPRLDGRTIDFSRLQIQEGDKEPVPFSFSSPRLINRQVPCYITYTNEKTHSIIRSGLKQSPLFTGVIKGTGVRYCPSIEDKVVKFSDRPRHQIFLEPEGLNTFEYYPNGLATSLPEDIQMEFLHSIEGLREVVPTRMGYGIEYDLVEPTQLYPSLQTKLVRNLFLAGQINGTTGYEEAAAQGLIAGINAALKVKGKPPFILDRTTGYIGVLIDDLVTKGTDEPYRMFTSRVEYRLILREDNADLRLRRFGFELGLVGQDEYRKTLEKKDSIELSIKYLKENKISYKGRKVSLYQLLKRPEIKIEDFKGEFPFSQRPQILKVVEAEVKYSGFIQRQLSQVRRFKDLEKIKIPNLDYDSINGLSKEIKEKLVKFRPVSLGQASRISGITPSAILVLLTYLRKNNKVSKGPDARRKT
jgi:tRNA uridine 5-carboxymethylaminomethyl modification enzyme